ncbi:MAG: FG-GAP repeat protein [Deltaproteobacteria bacterium]|nr:FG-GAP repeat protein [Deltaproteobacteria bacterium]
MGRVLAVVLALIPSSLVYADCPPHVDHYGAVYYFERPNNRIDKKPGDPEKLVDLEGDQLGHMVAAAGDVNGDGFPDYMASVTQDISSSSFGRPALKIFSGKNNSVIDTIIGQEILSPLDSFAQRFASLGDIDGDRKAEIVVTSQHDDFRSAYYGEVLVYSLSPLILRYRLVSPENRKDRFSESLAVMDDLNGDGIAEIVIGAPDAHSGSSEYNGRVYIVSGSNGALLGTLEVPPELDEFGFTLYSFFGENIFAPGDITGDGVPDLIVSAIGDVDTIFVYSGALIRSGAADARVAGFEVEARHTDFGEAAIGLRDSKNPAVRKFAISRPRSFESISGEVYIVSLVQASPPLYAVEKTLISTIPGKNGFGKSLANVGDIDGDGHDDLMAGAWLGSIPGATLGVQSGYVQIFSGRDYKLLFTLTGGTTGAHYGASVAYVGDANQDSFPDLIIGAPLDKTSIPPNALPPYPVSESFNPEPGMVSLVSVSMDTDSNGMLDVCETADQNNSENNGGITGGGAGKQGYLELINEALSLVKKVKGPAKNKRSRVARARAIAIIYELEKIAMDRGVVVATDAKKVNSYLSKLKKNLAVLGNKRSSKKSRSDAGRKFGSFLKKLRINT